MVGVRPQLYLVLHSDLALPVRLNIDIKFLTAVCVFMSVRVCGLTFTSSTAMSLRCRGPDTVSNTS